MAARPSMGKTAFVLNVAQHMAFKEGKTVAIFSLEMSKEQLVNRLFSLESKVDSQALRTGNLTDEDWAKLIEGAAVVGKSNLIIDDTPGISIAELRSKCRKFKLEHDLGIIIIDYLQLMFLYRDDYYNKDTDKKNIAEVIIAKQRNGPIGTVELVWLPNYTKFANMKK